MKIQMATLCERALVDDDHLNVVGGAAATFTASAFPVPLELTLAFVTEFDALDGTGPHAVRIYLTDADRSIVASVQTVIGPGRALGVGETVRVSVAVPLRGMQVPAAGSYGVQLVVAKRALRRLGLRVTATPCRVVSSGSSA